MLGGEGVGGARVSGSVACGPWESVWPHAAVIRDSALAIPADAARTRDRLVAAGGVWNGADQVQDFGEEEGAIR